MLTLLFASCGTTNKKEADGITLSAKWELTLLDGQTVREESPIYIELTDENKVSGFVGCNRLTGIYAVENSTQIRFDQLATTRMMCPEMELEGAILEMLNMVDNFTIVDDVLTLNIGRRAPIAIFQRMGDNEIANKYWKLKTLDGKKVEMAENQEREQFFILRSDNSISGFAGCNRFSGSYELMEGNRIAFNENMAVTMMACPDVDVDERAFLEVFLKADSYVIDGDTLHLNAGEKIPLAIFEAVYFQ